MRRKILREDILKAGMDLFHGLGYNGVSVGDITAKVGIPKGSFYNHFQSKNAFLDQVIDFYARESLEMVEKSLLQTGLSPIQRLKDYFVEATEFYTADPGRLNGCLMGNICQELASVDAGVRKKLERNFLGSDALLSGVLKEAVREGELDDGLEIPAMVQFITNGWQGALLRMKSVGNRQPLEAFQRVLFGRLLVKGRIPKTDIRRSGHPRKPKAKR
jgi:TetR/AcrR family transcriptional regulator, transcriptional repressor for nem operon